MRLARDSGTALSATRSNYTYVKLRAFPTRAGRRQAQRRRHSPFALVHPCPYGLPG